MPICLRICTVYTKRLFNCRAWAFSGFGQHTSYDWWVTVLNLSPETYTCMYHKCSLWWVGSWCSRSGSNSLESSVTSTEFGSVEADSAMQIYFWNSIPFLDSHKHFAILIVRDAHNGFSEILTELRDWYRIVSGRSFVKGMLYKCVTCRRFERRLHYLPPSLPLPAFRVKEAPVVTHIGVYYPDPVFIKSDCFQGIQGVGMPVYLLCHGSWRFSWK